MTKRPKVECSHCGKVVALESNTKLYGHSLPYHMRAKNRWDNWCPSTKPVGDTCPCCHGSGRMDLEGQLI